MLIVNASSSKNINFISLVAGNFKVSVLTDSLTFNFALSSCTLYVLNLHQGTIFSIGQTDEAKGGSQTYLLAGIAFDTRNNKCTKN